MATSDQFKNEKKFDSVLFVFLLLPSIFFDIISIVPILNFISLGFFGLVIFIFWIKGIRPKFLNALSILGLGVEVVPILSVLPGITGYVVTVFALSRWEDKALKATGKLAGPAGKAIVKGVEATSSAKRGGVRGLAKASAEKKTTPAPGQSGDKKKQSKKFTDTDQYGQKRGPATPSGQVSGGPIAQPDEVGATKTRTRRKRAHPASAEPASSSQKPKGREPSHPVLRRQAQRQEASQSARANAPTRANQPSGPNQGEVFDPYGNRSPTVPEKAPVATEWMEKSRIRKKPKQKKAA